MLLDYWLVTVSDCIFSLVDVEVVVAMVLSDATGLLVSNSQWSYLLAGNYPQHLSGHVSLCLLYVHRLIMCTLPQLSWLLLLLLLLVLSLQLRNSRVHPRVFICRMNMQLFPSVGIGRNYGITMEIPVGVDTAILAFTISPCY